MKRRTFEVPRFHVDDADRALPYLRQVSLELGLLMDDDPFLDSVRARLLRGLVERRGGSLTFRFDPERGRHRRGHEYVVEHGRLVRADNWCLDEPQELDDLRAETLLAAIRELWSMDLVRDVMAS